MSSGPEADLSLLVTVSDILGAFFFGLTPADILFSQG